MDLTEDKCGIDLKPLPQGNRFLSRTSVAQALRTTVNEWDTTKLKSSGVAKDSIIQEE